MSEQNKEKDTSKAISKYSDLRAKQNNIMLDSANLINNLYIKNLNTISENEIKAKRIETLVNNSNEIKIKPVNNENKLKTKIEGYNEVQTNNVLDLVNINKKNHINTQINSNIIYEGELDTEKLIKNREKKKKIALGLSKVIKKAKYINNTTNKIIKSGRNINTGINEGGLKSFESSSKILTKPIKKVANKVTAKATNKLVKQSTKIVKKGTNLLIKITKLISKLIVDAVKLIISMLPSIAPVIIILLIIICFCSFFGVGMSSETREKYEKYMIETQTSYDNITTEFYKQGKIVDGTIEGKGFINWKAALSIMQMLNGDLVFDNAEQDLLSCFKNAKLYEEISDVEYTYTNTNIDEMGNMTTEEVTDTKKVVYNASLEDYLSWCNNHFDNINRYKSKKGLKVDLKQNSFTDDEIEQIKLLYNSTSFFELFSDEFKNTYAYLNVSIGDEQIQAIYNEFLKNAGKRYVMDHSNLSYDHCMGFYDCSSWVIHCLAHTGIKVLPNTTAEGIYLNYCNPVNVNDRKPGDLIFLKDTYITGSVLNISHIGIYMGELNVNGEKAEWVIDTGGNPSGVKITKYNNGWWNGSHFYGFGRLK